MYEYTKKKIRYKNRMKRRHKPKPKPTFPKTEAETL